MTRTLMIVQNAGYLMVSFFDYVFCHGKDNSVSGQSYEKDSVLPL